MTDLHINARHGYVGLVIANLDHYQVDVRDREGRTAFHHAGMSESKDTIEALKKAGANVEARDNHQRTALHYAVLIGTKPAICSLLSLGVPINATDADGRTALHYAAMQGERGAIKVLKEDGRIEEHLRDNFGLTAKEYMVEKE
jgi:ankyrin repeat protein